MIGLIAAIVIFNVTAFTTNKRLTKTQVAHIWMFTIALQGLFDIIVDKKYNGYWYFDKDVEWRDLLPISVVVPAVNMIFLNWYPFKQRLYKHLLYVFFWVIAIVIYEATTLLPEPWGYFHYGWWHLWITALLDPILLVIILLYYKWILKLEEADGEV